MCVKRIVLFCIVFLLITTATIKAQQRDIAELSDAVIEVTGSFMDNPYHHSNTLKIYELTNQLKDILEDLYRKVPDGEDYYQISNMRRIVACLDFVTANIKGRSKGGIDATEWESTFHPIMTGFGWTWTIIHSTSDIVFYEYRKDNFKMVLAKNVRPKKKSGDYNANSFSCYTWEPIRKIHHEFTTRFVFGGNYQFVEYGDDETKYIKISKVTSKIGTNY